MRDPAMGDHYPPAPMAPHGSPFGDIPMGPPLDGMPMNDYFPPQGDHYGQYQGDHHDQYYNDHDNYNNGGKQKKNKNKNGSDPNRRRVEVRYEGWMLERAEPVKGEDYSWARIGKRALPFDEKKLQDIVRAHKKNKRTTTAQDYEILSSNQQGVIDRLIKENQLNEKDKNAIWILADVQRIGKWKWTTLDVKKVQVILKRQDKYQEKSSRSKNKKDSKDRRESKNYSYAEIIDLDDPIQKKKDNKKLKKSQSYDNLEYIDDRGYGQGGNNFHMPPPPPPMHPDNFAPQNNFQPPMHDPYNGPMHGPPLHPPQGLPFDPNGYPPPLHRQSSNRRPTFENPFEPDPQFAIPDQIPYPDMHSDDLAYAEGPRARTRSRSQRRRSSRPSISARRFSELEDRVDDLNYKMREYRLSSDSSDDTYGDDSIFSRGPDERDFSEPSSPRSAFSRGSLDRPKRRSSLRYRSDRYRDMEIVPHHSSGRQHSSRRRSSRPRLQHASTHDDYPVGRGGESRYPAPPQRRLTDFEERYDYQDQDDRRRRRGGRRHSTANYDTFDEGERRRGRGYYD